MKTLRCGDIVEGCGHKIEAASEQEVLAQAGRHAVEAHGMTVTPEVVAIVRDHIRDAKPSAAGS
jgi:predicted small metal-binding protein